jgi:hypothetical protein
MNKDLKCTASQAYTLTQDVAALTDCAKLLPVIVKVNGGKCFQLWAYKPFWPVITKHNE